MKALFLRGTVLDIIVTEIHGRMPGINQVGKETHFHFQRLVTVGPRRPAHLIKKVFCVAVILATNFPGVWWLDITGRNGMHWEGDGWLVNRIG